MTRNPSCLISCSQIAPNGGCGARVGRHGATKPAGLYEDRNTLPALRWFWSITVYVNPMLGIVTSGRAPTIEEAKAQFLTSWQKCRGDSTPVPRPST
jgi:hypothetical protein